MDVPSDEPVHIKDRKEIKFTERQLLGRGAFSDVVKGTFRSQDCACKVYTPRTRAGNNEMIREIQAYRNINHENVTKLLGFYINQKDPQHQAILILELADLDLGKIIIPNVSSF